MANALTRGTKNHKAGFESTSYPAGINLYDLDHPSRGLYLLRSGCVQLWHGRQAIVDHLTQGSFFGEKSLVVSRRDDQIARTLSPVKLVAFRKSDLLRECGKPHFALRLLKSLALRIDRYEQTIRDFVTERAERRLARLLYRFLPARSGPEWVRLPLTPTNPELAKMIGTTRWQVSHFLNRFQQMGWLRRQHGLWVHRQSLSAFLAGTQA